MLPYINIGQANFIPSYNLFVGIGIAMAMLFLQYYNPFKHRAETEKHKIHLSIIVTIVLGFVGAFVFDAYSQNIALTLDNFNQIGLTFLGGLFSGLIVLSICLKLASLPVLPTLNMLAVPFCIAHFFGRFGCFLAGCCFGSPTKFFAGVVFPEDSLAHIHYTELVKIHPTQLYESGFVLLLFVLFTKFKVKHQFSFYIIAYLVFRFIIEFIRADDRGTVLSQDTFSPSQVISIFTISIFIVVVIANRNIQNQQVNL